MTKNPNAVALGRLAAGVKKKMSEAAIRQRRAAGKMPKRNFKKKKEPK